jgi:hypothetical protein
MKIQWSVVLVAVLFLAGAGCSRVTPESEVPPGFVAVSDQMLVRIPENYRHEARDSASVLTDGECLVYLNAKDNKITGRSWVQTTETRKLGERNFNLTFYKDNNNPVRMDAHLIGSDARLSLDNPAGFVRCETEFQQMLTGVAVR